VGRGSVEPSGEERTIKDGLFGHGRGQTKGTFSAYGEKGGGAVAIWEK